MEFTVEALSVGYADTYVTGVDGAMKCLSKQ